MLITQIFPACAGFIDWRLFSTRLHRIKVSARFSQTVVKLSTVYRGEIFTFNSNFIFVLFSLIMQDEISLRFNKSKFQPGRRSQRKYSVRKGVLRNFTRLQENTCARVSFLIKWQASTGVFLWILQNF